MIDFGGGRRIVRRETEGYAVRSTTYDPAGTIFEGIDAFGAAGRGSDTRADDIRSARARHRQVAPQLRAVITPDDTCVLAFAATATRIVRAPDDVRHNTRACFAAVLHDRLVVAPRRRWLPPRPAALIVFYCTPATVTVEQPDATHRADRVTVSSGGESRLRITVSPGTADLVRDALIHAAAAGPATPAATARSIGTRP